MSKETVPSFFGSSSFPIIQSCLSFQDIKKKNSDSSTLCLLLAYIIFKIVHLERLMIKMLVSLAVDHVAFSLFH